MGKLEDACIHLKLFTFSRCVNLYKMRQSFLVNYFIKKYQETLGNFFYNQNFVVIENLSTAGHHASTPSTS